MLLIDQLKQIHVSAELDVIDTSVWFAKVARGEYSVGMNLTAAALDDPDVNFYENYACGSERNYTKYCNQEVEKLIDQQSRETDLGKRRQLVWEVERKLAEDVARPIMTQGVAGLCWQPYVKNFTLHHNSLYNNWRFDDVWLDRSTATAGTSANRPTRRDFGIGCLEGAPVAARLHALGDDGIGAGILGGASLRQQWWHLRTI